MLDRIELFYLHVLELNYVIITKLKKKIKYGIFL